MAICRFYVFPRSLGSIFRCKTDTKFASGIQTLCGGCGQTWMAIQHVFWKWVQCVRTPLIFPLRFHFCSVRINDCQPISHFGCWFSCVPAQNFTVAKTDLLRNHNGQSWAGGNNCKEESRLFSQSAQRRLPRRWRPYWTFFDRGTKSL